MHLPLDPSTIKGFLDPAEGQALYQAALDGSQVGPCLEIGSYCGKSSLYLGAACKQTNSQLFCVDHHRGSEENQIGEFYHDSDLVAADGQGIDTLPWIRKTLKAADLEPWVTLLVAKSSQVGSYWTTPLGLLFIDGGHSFEAAMNDYQIWPQHVATGGLLAIHDLYPVPGSGGQAPITIYRKLIQSGNFKEVKRVKSLGILQRTP